MKISRGWNQFKGLLLAVLLVGIAPVGHGAPADGMLDKATGLTALPNCTFVPTEWADGDSFRVRFSDGTEQTLRLYGADCVEWHVTDESDATRLRSQRRYFGLAGPAAESIETAKQFGEAAGRRTAELLAKPFTVYTAFADGRGDERFSRVYAFVQTAEGQDLATQLVREGLARAYGVNRRAPSGATGEEYQTSLKDWEMVAASNRQGIWKKTDWDQLASERRTERTEEAELALALRGKPAEPGSINPNTASRDELMSLPGIGETMAARVIEARSQGPYVSIEDLRRVSGIGPKALEQIAPFLRFDK